MRRVAITWVTVTAMFVASSSAMAAAATRVQTAAQAPDSAIQADIQRALANLDLKGPRLMVDVKDGNVTVSGMVPSLWLKEEAMRRVVKVGHFASFTADITIAKAESDQALAKAVIDSIRSYSRYSVYDNIDGRVLNGKISLSGAVTEPLKSDELLERIGKIHGVQAIDNKIEVLPTSESDNHLRNAISNAIYRDSAFENYSLADPPIHVIVNNGHVTLVGAVRTELERRKAESAARGVFGILALDDQVQISGGPRAR